MKTATNPEITTAFARLAESRRTRLLSQILGLILTLVWISVLGSELVYVTLGVPRDPFDRPVVYTLSLILVAALLINLRFTYRVAFPILLVAGSVATYLTAIPEPNEAIDTFTLTILVVFPILAGMFLSLRSGFVVAIIHGLGIILFGLFAPNVQLMQVLNGPWLIYSVLTAFSLLIAVQQAHFEQVRNALVAANEFQLRSITNTMRDAIFMTDVHGNIVYASASANRLFADDVGLKGKHLQHWLANVVADDQERLRAALLDLSSTNKGNRSEFRYVKDGQASVVLELLRSTLRDDACKPVGMVFALRDITERKQAESARLELSVQRERLKMVQHFVSDISHDLRTPLAVIGTSLYLIGKKTTADTVAVIQPQIEAIQAQVGHLEKQMDNLATFTRLQDPDARYHFESSHLNEVMESLVAEFASRMAEKRITLTSEWASVPRVMLSVKEFRQAMRHVLQNALQYTRTDGHIVVRTYDAAHYATLEIADSGIGIAPDDLKRIFDPLYRADSARGIDTGGMGLGLSVARSIIQAHSGSIEVESTVNVGTCFRVRLPILHEPAEFYTPKVSANTSNRAS
jgi:PAS domain S-box-containing protein